MHDEKRIPFPDNAIVEREIKEIVAKGIFVPESFLKLLNNMYKQIGIRFIMRDSKEMVIVIAMMALLMLAIVLNGQERYESRSSFYGIIMLVSPILYCLLSLLPVLKSKFNGMFEVEMTCKYNLYQLAAFRMLVFSVFCFLLNTVWVLSMAVKFSSVQFVQAFMISTTSLLLFSLLFLYVFTFFKTMFAKSIVMIGWMGMNALLVIIDSTVYHQLLISVPWYLYSIVICLSAYLYVKKLKAFFIQNKRRGVIGYVNG